MSSGAYFLWSINTGLGDRVGYLQMGPEAKLVIVTARIQSGSEEKVEALGALEIVYESAQSEAIKELFKKHRLRLKSVVSSPLLTRLGPVKGAGWSYGLQGRCCSGFGGR